MPRRSPICNIRVWPQTRGLCYQLGEGGGVHHCDGEVGGATHPVYDVTEGNGSEGLLNDKIKFYFVDK